MGGWRRLSALPTRGRQAATLHVAAKGAEYKSASIQPVTAGLTSFRKLREGGFAFVDKTRFAVGLALEHNFRLLIRPRRFGKTLLLDTVQCLHERCEELFLGTDAHELISNWDDDAKVPVVRFDLSAANAVEGASLFKDLLRFQVLKNAARLGVDVSDHEPNVMLESLLSATRDAHNGQCAAILIDEYDAPLLSVLGHNGGKMAANVVEIRRALHPFLLVLKHSQELMHSQLVTGATKFTLADMLSKVNHLDDISNDPTFGEILGFTLKEVKTTFGEHLYTISKKLDVPPDEVCDEMVRRYGGYSFDGEHQVLNTWDVSRALQKQALKDYWLGEGLTGWLTKLLTADVAAVFRPRGVTIPEVDAVLNLDAGLFEAIQRREPVDERVAWRALQQAGYLTVRNTTSIGRESAMVLTPPNEDVARRLSSGFFASWFPRAPPELHHVRKSLAQDNIIELLRGVNALCAKGTVYHHYHGNVAESQVQGFLSALLYASGAKFVAEGPTRSGRWDFLINGPHYQHLIETKMSASDDEDMAKKQARSCSIHEQLERYSAEVRMDNERVLRIYSAVYSKQNGRLLAVEEISQDCTLK